VPEYSLSPTGEKFQLPDQKDYLKELERLKMLVNSQRSLKKEIVIVMGVGFVGAVMAAVVADAEDSKGNSTKFVIGMQRPSIRSFWKIPLINRGLSPISTEDPEVALMIDRCVNRKKTLTATYTYDALKFADVVIVDVQCDYLKESLGNVRNGQAEMKALEESFEIIATHISRTHSSSLKQPSHLEPQSKLPIPSCEKYLESVVSTRIHF